MKVGVLTAALQELTPREVRDPDPDRAIEEWVEFAQELGASYIQLSAALHPTRNATCRPRRCSIRWRTRSTCASRSTRIARSASRRRSTRTAIGISEVGYFDNMLHDDPAIRKKKHDFMLRAFDAAALLGVDAVCGFVGRNQKHSMDQNLLDFEEQFVPLLKEAKSRGLTYRVEQCPMPGWTTLRQLAQQHRLHAGHLDRAAPHLREARRRRSVPHPLRPVARDPDGPGHALDLPVPEGQRLQLPDRRLPREGAGRRREGLVSAWGMRRPDASSAATGRTASRRTNPADQLNAWKKQVVLAEHELPGHRAARSAGLPAEPHGRLARSPARGARAAAARRGEHAPRRRARVPEGAHPGQGAAQADPAGIDRVRPRTSTRRRRACMRCSTRCSRRRTFRCRASAGEAYRS